MGRTMSLSMTTDRFRSGDVLVSDDNVYALTASLTRLGSGVSRRVYALTDDLVLKICYANRGAGGNLSEAAAWEEIEGTDNADYFARCFAVSPDGGWLIAERVLGSLHDSSAPEACGNPGEAKDDAARAARSLGVGDLHDGNLGWTVDGRCVVIDYAFNNHAGRMEAYQESAPSFCGCGDCQCARCYPDGCDCGVLEGCRRETCQGCWNDPAIPRRSHEDGVAMGSAVSAFGFVRGPVVPLCPFHLATNHKRAKPVLLTDAARPVAFPGQVAMFAGGWAKWDAILPIDADGRVLWSGFLIGGND